MREYFWRLLGGEEMELDGLGGTPCGGILGNAVVEELDRKIEREEINLFLTKTKNGKDVGKDGYPMEFWKEIIKNEEIGKIKTKVMNKIYETGKFPVAWKTNLLGRN
jgi:serine/threonine protein phosphatase PrpC